MFGTAECARHVGPSVVAPFFSGSFGLYNIVGNVWEWVQDDWCAPKRPAPVCRKPGDGDRRVKKGGSFLCHVDTCFR